MQQQNSGSGGMGGATGLMKGQGLLGEAPSTKSGGGGSGLLSTPSEDSRIGNNNNNQGSASLGSGNTSKSLLGAAPNNTVGKSGSSEDASWKGQGMDSG